MVSIMDGVCVNMFVCRCYTVHVNYPPGAAAAATMHEYTMGNNKSRQQTRT